MCHKTWTARAGFDFNEEKGDQTTAPVQEVGAEPEETRPELDIVWTVTG